MATTEHTINDALAKALRETRRAWRSMDVVRSENTGMLQGGSKRPDILVLEANVSPVVVETELLPAASVETDARLRLGERLTTSGRTILSAVAVRLPQGLRTNQAEQLERALFESKNLQFALYTGSSPHSASRWPGVGWLSGSVAELSILVQSASIPPDVIEQAANELVTGVSDAAGLIGEMAVNHPGAIHKISQELRQEDGEQTRRMAATILANAFVFQESLAGGPAELASVRSLEELRSAHGLTKSAVLQEWRTILKVNYWPIFDIARRLMELIPAAGSKALIESMARTADRLVENRLMRSHDLTGAVFQRLIADRKFLAAYYTTPSAAALLVGLAITPDTTPAGGSWARAEDVTALRVADFACGTGTLLSTAYQRIGQLHELAGGDSEALHPTMMARGLIGCDILPAAAHLTASMVSGAHPAVKYDESSILTVAYGKQPWGGVALGSLDMLDPQGTLPTLTITAKAAGGKGEHEKITWLDFPHSSFDVVIMNPPFTRPTGHEGNKIGVPNPMFAAFSSTAEEQRMMARATKRLTDGTSAHGNAGEGSIFLVLAHRKLKPGGVLALVLPVSLMLGEAWEKSRELIANNYRDLILVSIAGDDGADLSFSADSDIGECLVVGRKGKPHDRRATFAILRERPQYPLLGSYTAQRISQLIAGKKLRTLEDGPLGGTPLRLGGDVIGHAIDAPTEGSWNLARISDLALAQTTFQLTAKKRLWLPTMNEADAISLPISTVAAIGKIGPYHADINGRTAKGGIRGPFDIAEASLNSVPTYPAIWSHDADHQRSMVFDGDSEALPRKGATKEEEALIAHKVASIWSTASHCHFSRDFRFNSQSTSMQFTPRRTIGGRAWISIRLSSEEREKVLVLWANTSLGLLLHWYHANKQQSGRGSVGVLALPRLPVLDVGALDAKQLSEGVSLFHSVSGKALCPLHALDRDPVRGDLDVEFCRRVLRLPEAILAPGGPLETLRMKLSREPSIRGDKSP